MNCLNCDTFATKKFCSIKCQHAYNRTEKIQKWLRGELNAQRGKTNIKGFVKAYLVKQSGEKCSVCGWCEINPHSGKIPIEIDHIDGNPYNNIPENLRLLCPNCHSLTSTFRNLNKGNGRVGRNANVA